MNAIIFNLNFDILNGKVDVSSSPGTGTVTYDAKISIKDPTGTYIYSNLQGSIDDVSNTSPDVADICSLPTDSNGDILVGDYTLEFEGQITDSYSGSTNVSGTQTYKYCDTKPIPNLDMSISCAKAQLIVSDTTTTGISCNGVLITPQSYSYKLTTQYPNTLETPIADVSTTDASTIIGPNLWSGEFTSGIAITYVYLVDDFLTVSNSLYKKETANVACSNCLCTMRNCITKVVNRWLELKGTSPREAEVLNEKLTKLVRYYMIYDIAASCGNEDVMGEYCGLMKDLIESSLSCCSQAEDVDETSYEITPVASATTGGTVGASIWVDNYPDEASLSGVGVDGDIAIDNSGTGNLYKKTGGVWIFQVSLNGAAGDDGTHTYMGNYPDYSYLGSIGNDDDVAFDNSGTGNFYKKILGVWTLEGSLMGNSSGVVLSYGNDTASNTLLRDSVELDIADKGDTITLFAYVSNTLGDNVDLTLDSTTIYNLSSVSSNAKYMLIESEIINDGPARCVTKVSLLDSNYGTITSTINYVDVTLTSGMQLSLITTSTHTVETYTVKKFKKS